MCARGAQWNLSIFRSDGVLPSDEVKRHFVRRAIEYDNPWNFTKFQLREILVHEKRMASSEGDRLNKCKIWEDLAELYDLEDVLKESQEKRRACSAEG